MNYDTVLTGLKTALEGVDEITAVIIDNEKNATGDGTTAYISILNAQLGATTGQLSAAEFQITLTAPVSKAHTDFIAHFDLDSNDDNKIAHALWSANLGNARVQTIRHLEIHTFQQNAGSDNRRGRFIISIVGG